LHPTAGQRRWARLSRSRSKEDEMAEDVERAGEHRGKCLSRLGLPAIQAWRGHLCKQFSDKDYVALFDLAISTKPSVLTASGHAVPTAAPRPTSRRWRPTSP
jgi:hypothetical protein